MSDKPARRTALVAAVAGGLSLAAALLLLRGAVQRGHGTNENSRRYLVKGTVNFDIAEDPRRAVVLAVGSVRAAAAAVAAGPASAAPPSPTAAAPALVLPYPATVGELVYLLRGPPQLAFAPTAASPAGIHDPNDNQNRKLNGYKLRVAFPFIRYLQEAYLPATAALEGPGADGDAAAALARLMLRQLAAADLALRRLEVERAAAFLPNPDQDGQTTLQSQNAFRGAHVAQLLQQLWTASGRPASSFSLTGEGWAALGFQGENPLTDLRGSGLLGLKQLTHFARACPTAFAEMLQYNEAELAAGGSAWYLPAVVSTQLTALLQLRDAYPLYRSHLEVIYDSVPTQASAAAAAAAAAGGSGGAAATALLTRCTPRRELLAAGWAAADSSNNKSKFSAAERLAAVWRESPASDAEAGMYVLHHALLLHFKSCWERDKPHVMEYNTYMEKTVYPTFFCESWSMPEATQLALAKKK